MKSTSFALVCLLVAAHHTAFAGQRLVPAGSVIQCTTAESKLSSKTEAVGDPVLCQVGAAGDARLLGSAGFGHETYLVGRFEEYKDPGHFVGKGWMLLSFDRMVIEPETIVPINAKVVGVPGYKVDRQGRIRGKGHATRDTVEWMIPVLWPIDLLTLPRRGPRPALKAETRLMVKMMDDLTVPTGPPLQQDSPGLYRRTPSAYTPRSIEPTLPDRTEVQPSGSNLFSMSEVRIAPAFESKPARQPYAAAESTVSVTILYKDRRPPERIVNFMLTPTTLFVLDGQRRSIPVEEIDVPATERVNREAGSEFAVPGEAME